MEPKINNLSPQEKRKLLKLAKVLDEGNVAITEHLMEIEDKMEEIKEDTAQSILDAVNSIPEIEIPEPQEFPTQIEISNLPDVQKVEVTNFPAYPEQKAPIVNVQAPQVNVDAPVVNIDNTGVEEEIAKITAILNKPESEEIEETKIVDEDGKIVDFKKLFHNLSERIANIRVGGASVTIPNNLPVTITGEAIYATQVDDVSTTGVTYIGKAPVGSATSAPVWQVQKIDETGSPITMTKKWANSGAYTSIWDNRTSLTYG